MLNCVLPFIVPAQHSASYRFFFSAFSKYLPHISKVWFLFKSSFWGYIKSISSVQRVLFYGLTLGNTGLLDLFHSMDKKGCIQVANNCMTVTTWRAVTSFLKMFREWKIGGEGGGYYSLHDPVLVCEVQLEILGSWRQLWNDEGLYGEVEFSSCVLCHQLEQVT